MKRKVPALIGLVVMLSLATATFASADQPVGTYVYSLPTSEKVCVLTFDDAYRGDYLQRTLAILEAEGVPGTFFPTGNCEQGYPWRSAWIYAAGCDMGNHTYSHQYLAYLGSNSIRWQVQKTEDIHARTGSPDLAPLFREPGGRPATRGATADRCILGALAAQGYSNILWSVSSGDTWSGATAKTVTWEVLSKLHPGAIVLMHISHQTTPDALPGIIAGIKERGYTIVSLRDSLYPSQAGYNRYQQNCPQVKYSSWGWTVLTGPEYLAGSMRKTGASGAWAAWKFTGDSLEIIGNRGPTYGKAVLRIDDREPIVISYYRGWYGPRGSVYKITGLGEGPHKVKLSCASGRIYLDAIRVQGTLTY